MISMSLGLVGFVIGLLLAVLFVLTLIALAVRRTQLMVRLHGEEVSELVEMLARERMTDE